MWLFIQKGVFGSPFFLFQNLTGKKIYTIFELWDTQKETTNK